MDEASQAHFDMQCCVEQIRQSQNTSTRYCGSRLSHTKNVLLMMATCGCRYPGGADAATLSELRDACAGAMRYAQERNAYADEGQGQAALVVSWQAAVEVTFTRRWALSPPPCHIAEK